MNWNLVRRQDRSIDLVKAFEMKCQAKPSRSTELVLVGAEAMHLIYSRQVATAMIVQAINMEFIFEAFERKTERKINMTLLPSSESPHIPPEKQHHEPTT